MATWSLPPLVQVPRVKPAPTETVVTTGIDELLARLSVIPQLATAGAMNGMLEIAQEVMDDSKDNYCPFQFGTLRSSGVVYASDDGKEVVLSYGGPGSGAEDYALEQHERMDFVHPIGGPKYLERPVMAWTNRIVERAGQSVRSTIEKTSAGWASGDWKQIQTVREQPVGSLVRGYVRATGVAVRPYFRRKRRRKGE